MTTIVTDPARMNESFASAFNSRDINRLLGLYETHARLLAGPGVESHIGLEAIAGALANLLETPGTMDSQNRLCVEHGDLALLRADWRITGNDGVILVSGSSTELIRRQPDGRWLYLIDHAAGSLT